MHIITPTQHIKWRRRIASVALNTTQNLLTPVLHITISALVVRLASQAMWGEFVTWIITVQLVANILAWGNKEYLLRQFSHHPHQMSALWWSAFLPRLFVLCLICPPLVLVERGWLFAVWLIPSFIAQSFDVMIVYRKHFAFAVLTELGITAGIGMALVMLDVITLNRLFALFIIGAWCKALMYTARYTALIRQSHPQRGEGMAYFRRALPFFLLGLSGMLASRIDLYTLSAIASKRDVAAYQVAINLLLYLQASANYILIPFVKTLYRLDRVIIQKIVARLFMLGCLIVPVAVVAMTVLIAWVYNLSYPPAFWWVAGLFALPIFAYLPIIHWLYGQEAQMFVLWVNLIGAGCNAILNLMLIPSLGITGALTASAICQWGMLIIYLFRNLP